MANRKKTKDNARTPEEFEENMTAPEISIVMGSYNRRPFLQAAIESVRDNGITAPYEIIVVDGGSNDGSLKWLEQQKDIITIIQHNRGMFRGKPVPRRSWGYFINLGFKCAQGKYVCMLSDDCLVVPGAIMNGHAYFEEELKAGKNVGAVAFYYRDWPLDKNYKVYRTLGNKVTVNHGLFLKRALIEVGYAEEELYSFYRADSDLCLRLWHKGYICVDAPNSYVEHCHILKGYISQKIAAMTNTDKGRHDLDAYLNRWKGIYYDEKDDNINSTIEKVFHDDTFTADKFKRLVPFTAIFSENLVRVWRKVKAAREKVD